MAKKEGRLSARCIVSDRWLSFPSVTNEEMESGVPLTINVMTRSKYNKPKKICELIVIREELEEILQMIVSEPRH